MARHPAPRPLVLIARAAGVMGLALLVAACDLWPFGDPGEAGPQPTTVPLPTNPPRQPSPTILIPPPID